jgi:hypothetical protein
MNNSVIHYRDIMQTPFPDNFQNIGKTQNSARKSQCSAGVVCRHVSSSASNNAVCASSVSCLGPSFERGTKTVWSNAMISDTELDGVLGSGHAKPELAQQIIPLTPEVASWRRSVSGLSRHAASRRIKCAATPYYLSPLSFARSYSGVMWHRCKTVQGISVNLLEGSNYKLP